MKMPGQRAKPVVETQMISLADIAFLIIFFFMLSSQFMRESTAIRLPDLPKASRTESQISVVMDDAGRMELNGQRVADADELETRLRELLAGKKTPAECEVRFKCDRTLKYKDYSKAYAAITNAGGVIAIMHEVRE
jgi:biopolymer transport protein ExbD